MICIFVVVLLENYGIIFVAFHCNAQKEMPNDEAQKVVLKPELLEKCNHANVAKLTGDLTSALFSRKELATSSLTGKVANIHKNKNTAVCKEKLSPRRVNAIMCKRNNL